MKSLNRGDARPWLETAFDSAKERDETNKTRDYREVLGEKGRMSFSERKIDHNG